MPNLKDAPVIVAGQIIDVAAYNKRDTQEREGLRVTIMAGDGFAVVKCPDAELLPLGIFPKPFESVAWVIRNSPYSVDNNSGMSTRFVRVANDADLDLIHSLTAGKAAAASK